MQERETHFCILLTIIIYIHNLKHIFLNIFKYLSTK